MSNKKQSSVECLISNNKTICDMLLIDKISQSTYEQLINCFLINLEQAKEMHKEEIEKAYYEGSKDTAWRNCVPAEQYYNETFSNDGKQ